MLAADAVAPLPATASAGLVPYARTSPSSSTGSGDSMCLSEPDSPQAAIISAGAALSSVLEELDPASAATGGGASADEQPELDYVPLSLRRALPHDISIPSMYMQLPSENIDHPSYQAWIDWTCSGAPAGRRPAQSSASAQRPTYQQKNIERIRNFNRYTNIIPCAFLAALPRGL